jgi:hypothetical protein
MRADMALEEAMEKRYCECGFSTSIFFLSGESFTLGCSLDFTRFCFCAISAREARAGMLDVVLFSRRRDWSLLRASRGERGHLMSCRFWRAPRAAGWGPFSLLAALLRGAVFPFLYI